MIVDKSGIADIITCDIVKSVLAIWLKIPGANNLSLQGLGKHFNRRIIDGFYKVVRATCVKRGISKEVLAKAGLINCLDYYTVRHALKLC